MNMEFEDAKRNILMVLENNGILVDSIETDVSLSGYSIDSITFISIIIDLENAFSIVIPSECFTLDIITSIDGLTNLLLELGNEK